MQVPCLSEQQHSFKSVSDVICHVQDTLLMQWNYEETCIRFDFKQNIISLHTLMAPCATVQFLTFCIGYITQVQISNYKFPVLGTAENTTLLKIRFLVNNLLFKILLTVSTFTTLFMTSSWVGMLT